MLQSMGLQEIGLDLGTEQQQRSPRVESRVGLKERAARTGCSLTMWVSGTDESLGGLLGNVLALFLDQH